MKLDLNLTGIGTRPAALLAAQGERDGFAGVWTSESVTDALLMAMGATLATERIEIASAVAIAFARNPMTTAYATWDLASASHGRFALGLGTQTRPHVERRFDMPWSDPVERMVDFTEAVRAIWRCWQGGERLAYEGAYYRHTLMTPMFTPPHHTHPLRIYGAGVGERMISAVLEHLDGLVGHPFVTPDYFDRVVGPGLRARRIDRSRPFVVYYPLMLLVADEHDDEGLERVRERARAQIAFYGSTPEYRGVLDELGCGELQSELRRLSRLDDWATMTSLIDDRVVDAIAISGTPEQIPALIRARWGTRLDRVSSILGWPEIDNERMSALAHSLEEMP